MEEITPQKAEGWAKETNSIYNEQGQVADLGAAQEVARDQATKGMDAALATEARLEREANKNMTAEEETSVKLMEALTHKLDPESKEVIDINKHAFVEKFDKDDNKYMILRPVDPNDETTPGYEKVKHLKETMVFFCKDGVFRFSTVNQPSAQKYMPEHIDWTEFGKYVHETSVFNKDVSKYNVRIPYDFGDNDKRESYANFYKFDMKDPLVLGELGNYIKYSESKGLSERVKKEEESKKLDLNEMVSGLGLG